MAADTAGFACPMVGPTACGDDGLPLGLAERQIRHSATDCKNWLFAGTLYCLKIRPSYFRPRVSDDNVFAESLFRTAKYRLKFPASSGFKDLQAARKWDSTFVHWYNHDYSGLRYVCPAQCHAGQDREILAARDAL